MEKPAAYDARGRAGSIIKTPVNASRLATCKSRIESRPNLSKINLKKKIKEHTMVFTGEV